MDLVTFTEEILKSELMQWFPQSLLFYIYLLRLFVYFLWHARGTGIYIQWDFKLLIIFQPIKYSIHVTRNSKKARKKTWQLSTQNNPIL